MGQVGGYVQQKPHPTHEADSSIKTARTAVSKEHEHAAWPSKLRASSASVGVTGNLRCDAQEILRMSSFTRVAKTLRKSGSGDRPTEFPHIPALRRRFSAYAPRSSLCRLMCTKKKSLARAPYHTSRTPSLIARTVWLPLGEISCLAPG